MSFIQQHTNINISVLAIQYLHISVAMFALIAVFLLTKICHAQISSVEKIYRQPDRVILSEKLYACCAHLTTGKHDDLIDCTNTSVSRNFEQSYSDIPYRTGKEGPKLMVSLLTRVTKEIFPYASYSYFLQAAYADHNGYSLLPLLPDSDRKDYDRFRKLVPLGDALHGIASDCDYLVWLDAGR